MEQLKIFSMFDGVGGFTVGLNNANSKLFNTVYSNQFEPSRKAQDAFEVGVYNFPEINHSNKDISKFTTEDFEKIQQSGVNMIVGGFPCQDYSVARSKKLEMGIQGKKGVLFWEIIRAVGIIKPKFLVLENVDRLLKSPSTQRGRDFAIMLSAFNKLDYSVEWRVINAADYGRAQRRRRVFFFVYKNDTEFGKRIDSEFESLFPDNQERRYDDYIFNKGLFARQFPVETEPYKKREAFYTFSDDVAEVSDNFTGTVWNTGIMRYGRYFTVDTQPIREEAIMLKDIIQNESDVTEEYYIDDKSKLDKFRYLRGSKKLERTTTDGHKWIYSEGGMSPFDDLNLPARTMLTSEGSINRSTHLLKINNRFRTLTPIEAERIQDFPDNWTKYKSNEYGETSEVNSRMRMFFMGNALVTGIVKRIGEELEKIISEN